MELDPSLFEENARTASLVEPACLRTGRYLTETGTELPEVDIAYMCFGQLNSQASNAILVCHAISGNANCAQWWDRVVGPGKTLDTERYFIVGVNALGGCSGSTGPSSLRPDGTRYGSQFPMITIGDMVAIQDRLREHLNIGPWLLVCGGSMGGMQALEWSVRFPNQVRGVWATASCARHSALQIGFNEAARQSIMRDPKWLGGDYDLQDQPRQGLSVARMIGHLTFLSQEAFGEKFGRRLQDKQSHDYSWLPEFQIESYLNYQGDKFTQRFDANSLLILSRAIDYFDLRSLAGAKASFLFTSFSTDWLYPPYQSQELLAMAQDVGVDAQWHNIEAPHGHDAFLLETKEQGRIASEFLSRLE